MISTAINLALYSVLKWLFPGLFALQVSLLPTIYVTRTQHKKFFLEMLNLRKHFELLIFSKVRLRLVV